MLVVFRKLPAIAKDWRWGNAADLAERRFWDFVNWIGVFFISSFDFENGFGFIVGAASGLCGYFGSWLLVDLSMFENSFWVSFSSFGSLNFTILFSSSILRFFVGMLSISAFYEKFSFGDFAPTDPSDLAEMALSSIFLRFLFLSMKFWHFLFKDARSLPAALL